MKTILKFIIATVFLASSAVWSLEVQDLKTGKFDFEYSIYGNGRSKPTQVFDDGTKTYLQYPAGSSFPVFISPNGLIRYQYDIEGPYVVIQGIPRELIAQFGNSKTHIVHKSLTSTAVQYGNSYKSKLAPTTHGKNNLMTYTSDASRIPNSWIDNSYAKPIKGDVIQWKLGSFEKEMVDRIYFDYGSMKLASHSSKIIAKIANDIGNASEIIVVGSDDESYIEGLAQGRSLALKNALIRNGIDASRITMRSLPQNSEELIKKGKSIQVASFIKWRPQPISAAVEAFDLDLRLSSRINLHQDTNAPIPDNNVSRINQDVDSNVQKYSILLSDGTLFESISRWGRSAGWTVVNHGAPQIKITGEMEFSQPNFINAADLAIQQSRDAGYMVEAAAYKNNVLVIYSK